MNPLVGAGWPCVDIQVNPSLAPPAAGDKHGPGSYGRGVHRFEIVIDGAAVCVEADTWRRDLDADVVTFVERYREATRPGRAQEREVLRIRLDHPHRRIRRL